MMALLYSTVGAVLLLVACLSSPAALAKDDSDSNAVPRTWPDYFLEHKKYFEPAVYPVGDAPVWSINNTDQWAANAIVIEGDDGLIVYDTGLSHEHGRAIMAEIRKLSDKPVVAVFYSHHHPDHYNGTDAIVSAEDIRQGKVKIYAWHNFVEELNSEFGATGPAQAVRAVYYGGMGLPKEDQHYHGCCGAKYGGTSGYIPPSDVFEEDQALTIAGIDIEVFYTGGEASSEFGLYLPKYKAMMVADEIFPSVPNIYTIRGAKFRDAEGYLRAASKVLSFDVEHLLGSHLIPISGSEKIKTTITQYRDLVQWIHDQSVRFINKGYTIPELKEKFKEVPDYLENGPFSKEMYGTFEHIAPQMFAGYIGYFNGDAIEYRPTEPVELARRHIKLMGGRDRVYAEAKKSMTDDDPQFAAELLTYLIRVDHRDMQARKLKARAFRQLGYAELNTTWRSWYLTSAMELEGSFGPSQAAEVLRGIVFANVSNQPAIDIVRGMRYRAKAEELGANRVQLGYDIAGSGEQFTATLRNAVLLVEPGLAKTADVVVKLKRETFDRLVKNEISLEEGIESEAIEFQGSAEKLKTFYAAFDQNPFMERLSVR